MADAMIRSRKASDKEAEIPKTAKNTGEGSDISKKEFLRTDSPKKSTVAG